MRLMILTADYPPRVWSGIGVAVERQSQALAALGIDLHVLVAAQKGTVPDLPLRTGDGPVVHHLSTRRFPVDPRRFDLVHLHSLALSELALELRRRFGLPLIYTAHSLVHLELENGIERTPRAAWWRAVQAQILTVSDHVIFLSRAERTAAIELVPGLAERSSVIPNGVPSPPASLPRRVPDGPVVFAGRFARSKGIDLLAALIPRVLARRRCRFVLAGGHGDAAGSRAVGGVCVRFPGACSTVGWLARDVLDGVFARASLVLVPSLYEPFGLVALEAMRVGAPVLAAAVGGLAEIVTEESGGRLVHWHDPERWCEQIIGITSMPSVTQELRERGPKYVAARFNTTRLAEQLRDTAYTRGGNCNQ